MPLIIAGNRQASTGPAYPIEQSIRFNDDDTAYMSRTPSSAGNRRTWTWSGWVKRGDMSTYSAGRILLQHGNASGLQEVIRIDSAATDQYVMYYSDADTGYVRTNATVNDPSAWYHLIFVKDTTQAISNERFQIYINGVRQTSLQNSTYPAQNTQGYINNTVLHRIGADQNGSSSNYDGYLAEVHFLDGYAYGPEFFGEFTDDGIWTPKEYSGSYGTNGFYLKGADSSALGTDSSGQGNNYSTNGLATDDQVGDTPTNNHGVFNVLEKDLRYSTTLSNGNKKISFTSGSTGWSGTKLGLYRSHGKAYAEFKVNQAFSFVSGDGITVFVANDSNDSVSAGGGTGSAKLEAAYNAVDGSIYDGTSSQGTGTTWNTVNAVIGVYIDFDNGKGWFSKDGTVQTVNGTPNVETGANPHFTFTANTALTVGAGGVHYGTNGIVTLQNYAGEWATTPTSYTAFSTKAEGEA